MVIQDEAKEVKLFPGKGVPPHSLRKGRSLYSWKRTHLITPPVSLTKEKMLLLVTPLSQNYLDGPVE